MKYNPLFISIFALLLTGTANSAEIYNKQGNKVDLYGRVYALNYIDAGNDINMGDGDRTTGRLGFRGETQISQQITGFGNFERDFFIDSVQSNFEEFGEEKIRYAFAGFNFGQWGSFDYGRNDGILKSVLGYTDVLPEFGGDVSDANRFLTDRTNAVVSYRNHDFFSLIDDLNIGIQYKDDKDAYGLTAEYTIFDYISVAAGYAHDYNNQEMTSFATKYDNNDIYLAAIFAQSYKMDYSEQETSQPQDKQKGRHYEIVAQYSIYFENNAKLMPSIAYLQGKSRNSNQYYYKYIELGANHDFNKNMTAIIDYKFNRIKDQDDTLAVGIVYRF